jgi:mycofactocin precursor
MLAKHLCRQGDVVSEQVATAETATDITEPAPALESGSAGPASAAGPLAEPEQPVALQDLLVEEVSIDGMCGVY